MLTANVTEFPNSNKHRELPKRNKSKQEVKEIEKDMIKSYMRMLSNFNK